MGWLVAFFFAICTGLLVLAVIVQRDEHRKRLIQPHRAVPTPKPDPSVDPFFLQDVPSHDQPMVAPRSLVAADRPPTTAVPQHGPAVELLHRGSVLAGRYRIVATIGRGGMGVVYRAWDRVAERYMVIKMPRPDLWVDDSVRERFSRELDIVRTLDHPAIVPVVAVGKLSSLNGNGCDESAPPFAVMPYLAGGSLQRRRKGRKREPFPQPSSLWEWLPDVADALDHVHSQGLLHRDVKPANVLFDGLGRPYLADFGIAKAVLATEGVYSALTQAGFALGTPTYMAPELVAGQAIDGRADQYSLAVMVFEFLAGSPPFRAAAPATVLLRHATEPAPRLDSIRPALPRSLVEAVDRGLHKSREQRFVSCRAFADAVVIDVRKPRQAKPPKLMCPDCGRLLNIRHHLAGQPGRCPKCHVNLEISTDLQSLWLRRDRDEGNRHRAGRRRRPLPEQLEWIDRNGLLVTLVFTAAMATLAVIAWGFVPVVLIGSATTALAAWWFMGAFRGFQPSPPKGDAMSREAVDVEGSRR